MTEPRANLAFLQKKNRPAMSPAPEDAESAESGDRTLTLGRRPSMPPSVIPEPEDVSPQVESAAMPAAPVTTAAAQPSRPSFDAPPRTQPTTQTLEEAQQAADEVIIPVTVRIRTGTRNRAREAYRVTNYQEGDESFGHFVDIAILREIARREQLHNGGHPYQGSASPLRPGRSI